MWNERNKSKKHRIFQVDEFSFNVEEGEEADDSEDNPCGFME
jgi:hypothetical protein